MKLNPNAIDASELLTVKPRTRGVNTFLITPATSDDRSVSLRFAEYNEQISQALGAPATGADGCMWWRTSDPLVTMSLRIEGSTDVLLVLNVS